MPKITLNQYDELSTTELTKSFSNVSADLLTLSNNLKALRADPIRLISHTSNQAIGYWQNFLVVAQGSGFTSNNIDRVTISKIDLSRHLSNGTVYLDATIIGNIILSAGGLVTQMKVDTGSGETTFRGSFPLTSTLTFSNYSIKSFSTTIDGMTVTVSGNLNFKTIKDSSYPPTKTLSGTVTGVSFSASEVDGLTHSLKVSNLSISYQTLTSYFEVARDKSFSDLYDLFTSKGNNTVTGGDSGDIIKGNSGKDNLNGGNGDDTLNGGANADTMAGGAGNDYYIVDSAKDVLVESDGKGNDIAESSVSYRLANYVENLVLTGNSNIDATGNNSNNLITGNDGNNKLAGSKGDDTLLGNAGDDTLDGGAGQDQLDGGEGDDTYLIDFSVSQTWELSFPDSFVDESGKDTAAITGNANLLTPNSTTFNLKENEYFSSIENIDLSQTGKSKFNLTGNANNNLLIGNAANNTIDGSDGDDTLDGGNGVDELIGGTGNDTYRLDISVYKGNLYIEDSVTDNGGTDSIIIRGNAKLKSTGTFNISEDSNFASIEIVDISNTGKSKIDLVGNNQGNTLIGNAYNNHIDGGDGNDIIDGGLGNDTLTGGLGADVFQLNSSLTNTTEVDEITDFTHNEDYLAIDLKKFTSLYGATDANIASGVGLTAATSSTNYLIYNTSTGALYYDADGSGAKAAYKIATLSSKPIFSFADLQIYADNTAIKNVSYTLDDGLNDLVLMGTDNINGTGNNLDNLIVGNQGDNRLDGLAGADTMKGGAGNDTYVIDNPYDQIAELAGQGIDSIETQVSYDLKNISNIENITLSGSDDIAATGNGLDNIIIGNSGNNTLDGGDGNDTLDGGEGNDVYKNIGSDDQVIEAANQGVDTVYASSNSLTLIDNMENLFFQGNGDFTGTGNDVDNLIVGGGDNDSLVSLGGNDTINGSGGSDMMQGGLGNDLYYFNYGDNDSIIEEQNQGIDSILVINSSGYNDPYSILMPDHVENLDFADTNFFHGINVKGNAENNLITTNAILSGTLDGGPGNDTIDGAGYHYSYALVLIGGEGNDSIDVSGGSNQSSYNFLHGGLGQDTLIGDQHNYSPYGRDYFIFDSALDPNTNVDMVYKFSPGTDKLQLDHTVFSSLGHVDFFSDCFVQNSNPNALDSNDFILYDEITGELFYDADGNGAGEKIKFAILGDSPYLYSSDFMII